MYFFVYLPGQLQRHAYNNEHTHTYISVVVCNFRLHVIYNFFSYKFVINIITSRRIVKYQIFKSAVYLLYLIKIIFNKKCSLFIQYL